VGSLGAGASLFLVDLGLRAFVRPILLHELELVGLAPRRGIRVVLAGFFDELLDRLLAVVAGAAGVAGRLAGGHSSS